MAHSNQCRSAKTASHSRVIECGAKGDRYCFCVFISKEKVEELCMVQR